MDRDQLIDLTRRALKLARDKTTDFAPTEYTVSADDYASVDRPRQNGAIGRNEPGLQHRHAAWTEASARTGHPG